MKGAHFLTFALATAQSTYAATIAFCGTLGSISHIRPLALPALAINNHDIFFIGPDPVLAKLKYFGADHLKQISIGNHDLYAHVQRIFQAIAEGKQGTSLGEMFPKESFDSQRPALVVSDYLSQHCIEAAESMKIPLVSVGTMLQSRYINTPSWKTDLQGASAPTIKDNSLWSRIADLPKMVPVLLGLWKGSKIQSEYRASHGLEPRGLMSGIKSTPIATIANAFHPIELSFELGPNVLVAGPMIADVSTREKLSDVVNKFLEDHKRIVYLSLGQHTQLSPDTRNAIVQALRAIIDDGLIDGVFWADRKHLQANSTPIDSRFLFESWTTQSTVLEDPSVVLFISHCGGDSVHEAALAGVPVLGVPSGADQPNNAMNLERLGVAKWMSIYDIDTDYERFASLLRDLLNDPSYTSKMADLSAIARAQAAIANQKAAAFIDTIARFGPEAVQDYGKQFSWLKRHNYDLMLACAGIVISSIAAVVTAFRWKMRDAGKGSMEKAKTS